MAIAAGSRARGLAASCALELSRSRALGLVSRGPYGPWVESGGHMAVPRRCAADNFFPSAGGRSPSCQPPGPKFASGETSVHVVLIQPKPHILQLVHRALTSIWTRQARSCSEDLDGDSNDKVIVCRPRCGGISLDLWRDCPVRAVSLCVWRGRNPS